MNPAMLTIVKISDKTNAAYPSVVRLLKFMLANIEIFITIPPNSWFYFIMFDLVCQYANLNYFVFLSKL